MSGEAWGTVEGEVLHQVLKLFALALVAIMNFFYPWQKRCNTQPNMKLEENSGHYLFFTASFNSLQTPVLPSNPH